MDSPTDVGGRTNNQGESTSQIGAYIDAVQDYLGFGDSDDSSTNTRSGNRLNVSTVESFVRGNVIDRYEVSLGDGSESGWIAPFIVSVVNDRVNFDTLTEVRSLERNSFRDFLGNRAQFCNCLILGPCFIAFDSS